MEILFLAAGATAAATFLYCIIRGERGGRREPVRIEPGIGRVPDSARIYDLEVARSAARFSAGSNDEWQRHVAWRRENGLAGVLKDLLAEDDQSVPKEDESDSKKKPREGWRWEDDHARVQREHDHARVHWEHGPSWEFCRDLDLDRAPH